MDLTTFLGILVGVAMLVGSVALTGDLGPYIDIPSAVLVLGGTFAATLISYSFDELRKIPGVVRVAFQQRSLGARELVSLLVSLAHKARREGLLALEEDAEQASDPFLAKGIQLVVDGADPEMVRNILEIELNALEERHRAGRSMFETMGNYAPAFGMIGTLLGLIRMLTELDNPEAIGPGMALALVTTLYGAVLANLIFLPIAGKLREKSTRELQMKEVIIEGILSIQAGENPRMIEQKLLAFLRTGMEEEAENEEARREAVIADV